MSLPDMIPVHGSSNVKGHAYRDGRVYTWFHNGGVYSHPGTEAEFAGYQAASSKGKHFIATFKPRAHAKHA